MVRPFALLIQDSGMTTPITSVDSLRAVNENKQFDNGLLLSAGGLTGTETLPVSRSTGQQLQATSAQLATLATSLLAPQRQSIVVTNNGQSVFLTAGYSVGLANVFVAGVRLSPWQYQAIDGTHVTITDANVLAMLVAGMSIDIEAAISVAVSGVATVASVLALDPANQALIGTINGSEIFSARQAGGLFSITLTKLAAWIGQIYSQSPALQGTPTTPTPALGDNSQTIPNTSFVQQTVAAAMQQSVAGVLTLSVAGGSTVTLSAVQAANGTLIFTGILTASIAVVVPTSAAKWIVRNNTTGNFSLTVKTLAGTGVAVTQTLSQLLVCDGTNVNAQLTDFNNVALTGAPTAPTATPGTNTTQISTTAFATAAIAASVTAILSSISSTYAAIAGSVSQAFSVGPATAAAHAVQLQQLQARGLNASSLTTVTIAGNLAATVAGGLVILNAAVLATLPTSASVPLYSTIIVESWIAGATLTPQGTDTLNIISGVNVTNLAMNSGDSLALISTGTGWYGILGTIRDRVNFDTRYAAVAGSATQTFSIAKGTAVTHAAAISQVQDSSRVVGLIGGNDATTPSTIYDVSFASVSMREPATGVVYTVVNGAFNVNAATAGPVINGRDQSAVFAASQWLRLFAIYNPTTAATAGIFSLASATTGPALPSGYTSWAYLGSIYWGSGSTLALGNMRGARFMYSTSIAAISSGTATSLTAVPIPTLVPPECGWFELFFWSLNLTATGSASYSINCSITTQTSSIFNIGASSYSATPVIQGLSGPSKQITNFGQSFAYNITASGGTGGSVSVYVSGYSLPNGGE
jgi:hypothetical protein